MFFSIWFKAHNISSETNDDHTTVYTLYGIYCSRQYTLELMLRMYHSCLYLYPDDVMLF